MINLQRINRLCRFMSSMASSKKFLYFGYGSNLLRERIHIRNPTAVYKSIGKLQDYKLDFGHYGELWHGATATVTESSDSHVWGVVWEIDADQQENLDNQEDVHRNVYKAIQVDVRTPEGAVLSCRCYTLVDQSTQDKRPSPHYLNVILQGAKENGLPEDYIKRIEVIEHNGFSGDVGVDISINKDL